MYENDRRTGTDYEYNHSLDMYLQEQFSKKALEPKSLDDSLVILNEYKKRLTGDQYASIESTIKGQAQAGLFCDREDIERMARQATGEISYDEAKKEALDSIKGNHNAI